MAVAFPATPAMEWWMFHRTTHVAPRSWRILPAIILLVFAARVSAQDVGPDKPDTRFNHGTFRFDAAARDALRQLWSNSIGAKEERVACLGGRVQDSVVYITRIEALESTGADSANISALTSIARCGPPAWLGTVHTHIAKFDGQPFIIFSQNDRRVMQRWQQAWKQEGVFCILYSDADANCEAGYRLSGQALYSSRPWSAVTARAPGMN
jgi:hypothetical protein